MTQQEAAAFFFNNLIIPFSETEQYMEYRAKLGFSDQEWDQAWITLWKFAASGPKPPHLTPDPHTTRPSWNQQQERE
jgi:hypothetical protein